ncbi:ribosome-associated translation inhibitor RaiA [bacterium]|nr:ribosome-associated translation inhibitor RaiA [bacterium]
MNISIVGRHCDVSDELRAYIEERLSVIRRHFDRVIDVDVILSCEKYRNRAEVNIHASGTNMSGHEETKDMYTSIDLAVDKIDRQVRRYKEKLVQRHRNQHKQAKQQPADLPVVTYELLGPDVGVFEEGERKVILTEKHTAKPMTVDEAVMQMDLNHTDFFVFTNTITNKLNVVYRRADSNVGWIAHE